MSKQRHVPAFQNALACSPDSDALRPIRFRHRLASHMNQWQAATGSGGVDRQLRGRGSWSWRKQLVITRRNKRRRGRFAFLSSRRVLVARQNYEWRSTFLLGSFFLVFSSYGFVYLSFILVFSLITELGEFISYMLLLRWGYAFFSSEKSKSPVLFFVKVQITYSCSNIPDWDEDKLMVFRFSRKPFDFHW